MVGTASMLKSARRLILGNLASLIRRTRRRSLRSSTSAERTSRGTPGGYDVPALRSRPAGSTRPGRWVGAVHGRQHRSLPGRRCRCSRQSWWWSWGTPGGGLGDGLGEQLVVVAQGGGRSVIAGQRTDREHRRNVVVVAGSLTAGVDQDRLRVQTGRGDGAVHRSGQHRGGQGPVGQQDLDQGTGAGCVATSTTDRVPIPLVRWGERAHGFGLSQRGGTGHSAGFPGQHLQVVV